MRRYFESLRPADASAIHSVPNGIFLVRVDRFSIDGTNRNPITRSTRERGAEGRVLCARAGSVARLIPIDLCQK
jgi:hypothetical protein